MPSRVEDLKGGRIKNRRRVVDLLRQNGALSLATLSDRTGLSRATVSSLVSELRQHGLVVGEEIRSDRVRTGRPLSMVALDDSAGAAVGINITSDAVQVAVADVGLNVLAETMRRPDDFDIGHALEATLRLTADMVDDALATLGLDRARVLGGTLGVPAPIDRRDGTVGLTSLMPSWV